MPDARRVLLAGVVALALGACSLPSSPPPDPANLTLRAADVPADLQSCPGAGAIDHFLRTQAVVGAPVAGMVAGGWTDLRAAGALAGAIAAFATRVDACAAAPAGGPGRTATSLVARFADADRAVAAYNRGALGFPTPPANEVEDGLMVGIGTQLGEHAWVLERQVGGRALTVAYWQRHEFVLFFISADLDPVEARRAISSMDGRVA